MAEYILGVGQIEQRGFVALEIEGNHSYCSKFTLLQQNPIDLEPRHRRVMSDSSESWKIGVGPPTTSRMRMGGGSLHVSDVFMGHREGNREREGEE